MHTMLKDIINGIIATLIATTMQAQTLVINEVMTANVDMFLSPSTNFDGWIELYNPTSKAIDINGYYVSDDASDLKKWQYPHSLTIAPKGFATLWFDHYEDLDTQVPFKLDNGGGSIFVSNGTGTVVARADYPQCISRTSYARTADNGDTWGMTAEPTPGRTNQTSTFATEQLAIPYIDKPSQMLGSKSVSLSVDIPEGTTLRYTTDGTTPTMSNGMTSSDGRFSIGETTAFRFRLFKKGMLPSKPVTRTFIKPDMEHTLPVVAVVCDDNYLYDDEIGVMVKGTNGKSGNGQDEPCNWNMEWERPVSFTLFNTDGSEAFSQDTWLELSGGWSRAYEPHSFKLKANKVFGTKKSMEYAFFADKPIKKYKSILMRNGGGDTSSRILDAALQTIAMRSGIDLDMQSYMPTVHYINGVYKGLINMREPSNKHYVWANYGWDDDEIDFLEMNGSLVPEFKCGDSKAFDQWLQLSDNAEDNDTYHAISALADIDEYINYMALELFLGNNDWMRNNIKMFRHRNNGKYRTILFDLDAALKASYPFAKIEEACKDNNPQGRLFVNMLRNDSFRRQFIDTYCLMAGSIYRYDRAAKIADELAKNVESTLAVENLSAWTKINFLKKYLASFITNMEGNIRKFAPMQLTDTEAMTVSLNSNTRHSELRLNGIAIPYNDFSGKLFPPATVTATPTDDYIFECWKVADSDMVYSTDAEIVLPLEGIQLTAIFHRDPSGIRTLQREEPAHKGLYDLQGRPIPQSPVKGVYIRDGKKVVVSK